jgi:hypothetical protein
MNPPGVDEREHLVGIFRMPWGDSILYRVDEFGKLLLHSGSIRLLRFHLGGCTHCLIKTLKELVSDRNSYKKNQENSLAIPSPRETLSRVWELVRSGGWLR